MPHQPHRLIPASFTPGPSLALRTRVEITPDFGPGATIAGYAVSSDGPVPAAIGLDRAALTEAGFTGAVGQTLVLPQASAPTLVAVGVGEQGRLTTATLRDAAAAFARAGRHGRHLATDLVEAASGLEPVAASAAVVEGALLARYRYLELKTATTHIPLEALDLVGSTAHAVGVSRGLALARATALARDLAAAPPSHLTATIFGDFAEALAPQYGLEVSVFDKAELIELGCGGLLGVNAGSIEEPRMIEVRYRPSGQPTGHLAFVGKGIMYDSGGIALKPGDVTHLAMKMDMSGAGAIFATMTALAELGCENAVTEYLMCTDNMPSGSATAMGDVLTIRGGTTVEVKNTDAEGRLVMADGLVLANEEGVDAIVDLATLTGAALVSLGPMMAALFGNDQGIIDQVRAASDLTDETVWQLPLDRRYRNQLNSDVADMSNLGGPYAGATTAALFLADFVGDTPWAHVDMCGPMQSDSDDSWRTTGPTGFGARLLAELAIGFRPPAA
ncbi:MULTISPECIES: leucyl aminopeptidase family protein [unclassified Cryobacterium]|uniref:leucyl aminopeptidase family protein n=1 Tax=unclassified Cryobacterium TaxID=2649013 RepID=UPI002AB3E30D|nr:MULTISPECIES: M17 family peptidase N-terminal domain-containing protein [unclassified Cryobacterium]MDY7543496.1 M17 family peptidase N-terminal domain-containing protein [Cryobacterium sp. 5B3]MEA9999747.1 M17 family peptidase N-terminal domain-containing protein [Cryobacterium sp. RTS3]MEB0266245.1 M17 family peptidase N-terminal domain-containing protein [Cryobacterium sp. 10I5]MEB0273146.1 M17 family peptidase N-terminal domain-containing protein [Cryobacterium sp. 5B3]